MTEPKNRTVPDALQRRGITAVRDNVPEGMAIGGIARNFALIFREEIQQRFISTEGKPCVKQA